MRPSVRGALKSMIIGAFAPALLTGCMFQDLKEELKRFDNTFGIVGKIAPDRVHSQGNVLVILYEVANDEARVLRYVFPEDNGYYSFLAPGGTYHVGAFEDANENLKHDPGEYAGMFGVPDEIILTEDRFRDGISRTAVDVDITLAPAASFGEKLPSSVAAAAVGESLFKVGALARLDDPIFDYEHGGDGYWKPLSFLKQFGVGVYFLEPYDPQRIPVLFVHGATGSPRGWKDLAESLDKTRYQTWLYYYPSGVRLDIVANTLDDILGVLHEQYGFTRLAVTAHSMGGLVSRAALLRSRFDSRRDYTTALLAMSTPWGGMKMAQKGVEQAPVAIPSWHDVAPGSDFIRSIYSRRLAPDVTFALFFSLKGDCAVFMANNDGTVELASQLDYRAQSDAAEIFGFNEDHMSILSAPEVIKKYNETLGRVFR